jgi:hypothetical protein
LAALTAAAVEGLTAAERAGHVGRLLCGLAALVDQQREQAAGLDRSKLTPVEVVDHVEPW